ncbi:retrovirus-related pol polyprotein from transposon TNT 1-94, partial [Tanacetum coccineum]
MEGLGHNLFSVGQFCDSDLEVAFHKPTCFVRNLESVDLIKGSRGSNLYTLSLAEMIQSSPICILSKALKTKSWLWHRRLSHLNFAYINELAKQGKSKKHTHKPKSKDSIQEKLYLLHMDLCDPMRIKSINGKKYILVIVDDYSRFTWVKFLRSNDETLEFTLKAYYEDVRISHQTTVARTPQQNGIVERQNQTLVEVALTLLIFSKASLFLWAEKPDLTYFHVFGALCYPTNDSEDLGKLKPKVDIGICVGYALVKKAYRIYNKQIHVIIETIHVEFHELIAMASKQFGSGPELKLLTPGTIIEPKNFIEALLESSWIDAMQEEIHEFERLDVWELVPCPDLVMIIKLVAGFKTPFWGSCLIKINKMEH